MGLKVISCFLRFGIFKESFNVKNDKAQHLFLFLSILLMQQKATKSHKNVLQLIFFFPFS